MARYPDTLVSWTPAFVAGLDLVFSEAVVVPDDG
jgi:hypothetical protein